MLRTLNQKLLLASGGLLLGVAIAAAFIITNVLRIRSSIDHLTTHTTEQLELTGHFNTHIFRAIVEVQAFVRDQDSSDRADPRTELRDARAIIAQLSPETTTPDVLDVNLHTAQMNLQQQRIAVLNAVEPKVLHILQAAKAHDTAGIERGLDDLIASEIDIERIEERSADLVDQSLRAATARMNTVIQRAIAMTLGLFGLVGLAVLGLVLFMRQTIVRPIIQLSLVARMVAEGNLNQTIIMTSNDEVGSLQATFNHMVTNLQRARDMVLKYQGTLEACVAERTAELAVSNAHLQLELAERIGAETALVGERASLAQQVAERTGELRAANIGLSRAAQLKDEFLASMSHELRTPLNAVLGFSEALQEEIYGALNDQQRQSLHSIEESGRHLLELINDILDLAKIGAGKLELALEPASIVTICQASLRMIMQLAHTKQLSVDLTLDPAVTLLHVDARRLKQILVNLLSNAVKFTSAGGSIGLEVVGDTARKVVNLTVWDTGIGIAHEHLGTLFQPFVQLDSRLSRQYEGTGLGLALVYRMVELHGGSVSLTSEVGRGSRFTVALPWDDASTAGGMQPERWLEMGEDSGTPAQPAQRACILVVDDNTANLALVTDYLISKGYQVVVAHDGAEAIAQTRATYPDVIVMDIQMPGMDGLEAIRCIRADPLMAQIPIIALTALAMPGDRERCLAAGATDYLSKPVRLQDLVHTIEVQHTALQSMLP